MNFITDDKFIEAIELIKTKETITIAILVKDLNIGINYASMIIDDLQDIGLIADYSIENKDRKVLTKTKQ